jgi:hypothetical protein
MGDKPPSPAPRSHLFTVRLWREHAGGATRWRGLVRHVLSGKALAFEDWQHLIAFFTEILDRDNSQPPRRS